MKPYRESISKLESVESDIIQTKDQEERLAKLEGTGKHKRKRAEDSKDPNKNGDHKGKGKGKGNKWRNNKDGSPFKKSYQSKKDQEFAKQVLNVLKQQKEQEEDSSDSDHSTGWQRHCNNKQERVYVLGASQGDLDCSDSDMSITSIDAKKHLKRYRKQQKKKRKGKR